MDEYYCLNKKDPNYILMRATANWGQDAHTDGKFGLSDKGALGIIHLLFASDEKLYGKRVTNFFQRGGSGLQLLADGYTEFVDLAESGLVFITNSDCVGNSSLSSQNPPASSHTEIKPNGDQGMWREIAAQTPLSAP